MFDGVASAMVLRSERGYRGSRQVVRQHLAALRAGCRAGTAEPVRAESLTVATMALCPAGKGRPESELLRRALYQWAFNAGRRDLQPPADEDRALAWAEKHSPAVADLDSAKKMRAVLDELSKKQDGSATAANTIRRRRAVLSNCLRLAVEKELLPANPLTRVHREAQKGCLLARDTPSDQRLR